MKPGKRTIVLSIGSSSSIVAVAALVGEVLLVRKILQRIGKVI